MATNLATLVVKTLANSTEFRADMKLNEKAFKGLVQKVISDERRLESSLKRAKQASAELFKGAKDVPDPFERFRTGVAAINKVKGNFSAEEVANARKELARLVKEDQKIAAAGGYTAYAAKQKADAAQQAKLLKDLIAIESRVGKFIPVPPINAMNQFNQSLAVQKAAVANGTISVKEYIKTLNALNEELKETQQIQAAGGPKAFEQQKIAKAKTKGIVDAVLPPPPDKAAAITKQYKDAIVELNSRIPITSSGTREYTNALSELNRQKQDALRLLGKDAPQVEAANLAARENAAKQLFASNAELNNQAKGTFNEFNRAATASEKYNSRMADLSREQRITGKTSAQMSDAIAGVNRQFAKDKELESYGGNMRRVELANTAAERTTKRNRLETQKFLQSLSNPATLAYRSRLREINRELSKGTINQATAENLRFKASFDVVSASASKLFLGLAKFSIVAGVLTLAVGRIVSPFKKLFNIGEEFNRSFTESTAIIRGLSVAMEQDLVRASLNAAKEVKKNAAEVSKGIFFLVSSGFSPQAAGDAVGFVSKFAQAASKPGSIIDLSQAVDLLTDSQSALGLTSKLATENLKGLELVGNKIVSANTLGNASVIQFSEALNNAAPTARIFNASIDDLLPSLIALANQGVKGEDAGTKLGIAIRDLSTKAIKNADAFAKNNIEVFDSLGRFKKLEDIMGDVETATKNLSDEAKKQLILDLGLTDRSFKAISLLVGQSENIRGFRDDLIDVGDVVEEISQNQFTDLEKAQNNLRSAFDELGQSFSSFVQPAVIGLTEALTVLIDTATRDFELSASLQRVIESNGGTATKGDKKLFEIENQIDDLKEQKALLEALNDAIKKDDRTDKIREISKEIKQLNEDYKILNTTVKDKTSDVRDVGLFGILQNYQVAAEANRQQEAAEERISKLLEERVSLGAGDKERAKEIAKEVQALNREIKDYTVVLEDAADQRSIFFSGLFGGGEDNTPNFDIRKQQQEAEAAAKQRELDAARAEAKASELTDIEKANNKIKEEQQKLEQEINDIYTDNIAKQKQALVLAKAEKDLRRGIISEQDFTKIANQFGTEGAKEAVKILDRLKVTPFSLFKADEQEKLVEETIKQQVEAYRKGRSTIDQLLDQSGQFSGLSIFELFDVDVSDTTKKISAEIKKQEDDFTKSQKKKKEVVKDLLDSIKTPKDKLKEELNKVITTANSSVDGAGKRLITDAQLTEILSAKIKAFIDTQEKENESIRDRLERVGGSSVSRGNDVAEVIKARLAILNPEKTKVVLDKQRNAILTNILRQLSRNPNTNATDIIFQQLNI